MANAAFTIVQNDMVILELWLSYYSRFFDHLGVLGQGTRPEFKEDLDRLNKKYPLDFGLMNEDVVNSQKTVQVIIENQAKLLKKYKWVLYADCDEFVVADPRYWKDLKELMRKEKKKVVYCEGYSVIQIEGEGPIDYSKPYLQQRTRWFKDAAYNKPLLARRKLNWVDGCHKEHEMSNDESRNIRNTGLFMLHLKYGDLEPQGTRHFGPILTPVDSNYLSDGYAEPQTDIPNKIREVF